MFDANKWKDKSGSEILEEMTFEDIKRANNDDIKGVKSVLYKLNSMANKRTVRLNKSGVKDSNPPHFSVKGITDINMLKKAWRDVRNFLKDPMRSLQGRKTYRKKVIDGLKEAMRYGGPAWEKRWNNFQSWLRDPANFNRFWRAWDELNELHPIYDRMTRYEIMVKMYEIWQKPSHKWTDERTGEDHYADIGDMVVTMESLVRAIEQGYDTYWDLLKDDGYIDDSDIFNYSEYVDLKE